MLAALGSLSVYMYAPRIGSGALERIDRPQSPARQFDRRRPYGRKMSYRSGCLHTIPVTLRLREASAFSRTSVRRWAMTTLNEEIAAYDRMRGMLETEHLGRWVVIRNRELAGSFDTFEAAAESAVERFGRGPYLIRKVGEGPVALPASVLYVPTHA